MTTPPDTTDLARVDRSSTSTMWLQILLALEGDIASGTWRTGEKLPSETAMQERYGVSRTTVRRALARLEEQGIINRQKGRGSFVTQNCELSVWALPQEPQLIGTTASGGRSPLHSTILRAGIDALPAWASAALSQKEGEPGFILERTRSLGSLTAAHVVNYLPKRFAGLIPSLRDPRASLYEEMRRVAGVEIARLNRTIEAITADKRLATLLEVEEGHPLVVVEAVAYDSEGTPVDVSKATVRTDRLSLRVENIPMGRSRHIPAVEDTTS